MDTKTKKHLTALKASLLTLKPIGSDGFEGLLAVALSAACGQPFRLASSGSQRGRDGDSAFDNGAVYFEGKLYHGAVPKDEIAVKLMALKADNQGQVDTWILGATSAISAQHAELFVDAAGADGIGIVLLDWSSTAIPPLAIAIVAADTEVKDFLRSHVTAKEILTRSISAIDHITKLPDFAALSAKLREALSKPSVALGLAKTANRRWFQSVFRNRVIARQHFGQPIAPADLQTGSVQPRTKLEASLQPGFAGQPDGSVFFVIGGEGAGKSWLVAQTWLISDPASILLIATADQLKYPDDLQGLEDFLIACLIRQTGVQQSVANETRWRRRVAGWRANPNPANVRITLWIDGLNQAPTFPWPRWIDAASLLLEQLGGQLIVTTRSAHFARLRDAITSPVHRIVVSDWTPDELTAILEGKGIDANVLSSDVFIALRNPRILSIALELLSASDIENMQELTVGRLLFEHVRRSDRVGMTLLQGAEFAKALQELARDIVNRLKLNQQDDLRLVDIRFDERLRAVSSSRFFKPVGDDPDLYEIEDDGLQLALGLWLVSSLEAEVRNHRDPATVLGAIVDPIGALDMTADVIGSALEVACLRPQCPVEVAAALLRHYVGLQNLPQDRLEAFASLCKRCPHAFVRAAEDTALAGDHSANADWLTYALVRTRADPTVWEAVSSRLPQWLASYCPSPDGVSKTGSQVQRRAKIEENMQVLTDADRQYVADNLRPVGGDVDKLHRLAFFYWPGCLSRRSSPRFFAGPFPMRSTPVHACRIANSEI